MRERKCDSVYTAPLTTYQLATWGKGEQLGGVGGRGGEGEGGGKHNNYVTIIIDSQLTSLISKSPLFPLSACAPPPL